MKILLFFIFLFSFQFFLVFSEKTRDVKLEDIGDDYSDFSNQEVKNGGANHNLKQVSYSTIAPKLEIPTRPPPVFNKKKIQNKEIKTQNVQPYQYRRGYFFQHYPWDQLPRRYLLRPGMTYVYPQQYQYANYKYPFLPTNYNDPYNIYKSHPGIGGGCGGGYGGSGCGGGYQQGGGGYGGGCGGSGRGACDGGDSEEDSYEDDEEDERSGEAKINKKDPLEDLELEDLEKISKSSDDEIPTSKTKSLSENFDSTEIVPAKSGKLRGNSEDDDDLIDDRKKKFLIKWA